LEPIVSLDGIYKSFHGVNALSDISIEIPSGEIVGIVGENGAGKSTLIKIIGGALQPDAGRIIYKGSDIVFSGPSHALKEGVGIVYQELSLCENLSIAENIGLQYLKNSLGNIRLGVVNKSGQHNSALELFRLFGMELDPCTKVKDISLAQQEQIEIMRAIAMKPDLLILDEPTGPLSWVVREKLFSILKEMKERGTTILYISHEIGEVIDLCSAVVVLRDGRYITTLGKSEMEDTRIANLMVGRELGTMFPERANSVSGDSVLEIDNFSHPSYFRDISFDLRKGEILGISGLIGAGRTELALSIFGIIKNISGSLKIKGEEKQIKSPKDALHNGINYLTEDRKRLGLFLKFSILENFLSIDVKRYSKNNFVDRRKIKKTVRDFFERFSIKAPDENVKVITLSGGNQQKILLSKVVSTDPDILIIDEPTRGVDIGAKKSIHESIRKMADSGKSVILISSEMTEIIGMSDRILIMDCGRVVDLLENDSSVTQELIMNKIIEFKSRERNSA
jgi:ABC-type sugar transport system ATPase subunit